MAVREEEQERSVTLTDRLKQEIGYDEYEDQSVDFLIDYKNALENVVNGVDDLVSRPSVTTSALLHGLAQLGFKESA